MDGELCAAGIRLASARRVGPILRRAEAAATWRPDHKDVAGAHFDLKVAPNSSSSPPLRSTQFRPGSPALPPPGRTAAPACGWRA
jgi:hypothetical protein